MSAPVRCVHTVGSLPQGNLLTFVVSCVLLHSFVQTGNQHIYQPVGKQGNITLQVPELTTTHTQVLVFNFVTLYLQITYNSLILHPLSDSCLQNTVYSCHNTFNCTLSDSKTLVLDQSTAIRAQKEKCIFLCS